MDPEEPQEKNKSQMMMMSIMPSAAKNQAQNRPAILYISTKFFILIFMWKRDIALVCVLVNEVFVRGVLLNEVVPDSSNCL
jgi:hypothetical protein